MVDLGSRQQWPWVRCPESTDSGSNEISDPVDPRILKHRFSTERSQSDSEREPQRVGARNWLHTLCDYMTPSFQSLFTNWTTHPPSHGPCPAEILPFSVQNARATYVALLVPGRSPSQLGGGSWLCTWRGYHLICMKIVPQSCQRRPMGWRESRRQDGLPQLRLFLNILDVPRRDFTSLQLANLA